MIYAITLDRSEVGHVMPVVDVLLKMGREVVVVSDADAPVPITRDDTVLCVGDRYQLLRYLVMRCPASKICQLHAGEITTAAADDYKYRHAIGALATRRMTATMDAFKRSRGNDPLVGSPCLAGCKQRIKEARESPPLAGADYVVFAMNGCHGCMSNEIEAAAKATIAAAGARGWRVYTTPPNCEFGTEIGVEAWMRGAGVTSSGTYSVGHADFQRLIAGAHIMIGNSSAGIIEAPSLGTPTIDIAPRQNGRPNASSVMRIQPSEVGQMSAWFDRALTLEFGDRPYDTVAEPDVRAAHIVRMVEDSGIDDPED